MARDISHEEARDEKIDELTFHHYTKLRAQLQAGNDQLASAIGESIAQHMSDDICNEQMIYAVMPNGGSASPRYKKLIENALEAMAEVEAVKEVERLEKDRQESQDEARADRAVMDRAMNG